MINDTNYSLSLPLFTSIIPITFTPHFVHKFLDFVSMELSRESNDFSKDTTPSASNFTQTVFISISNFLRFSIISCASPASAARISFASPWSKKASRVASGTVLTVFLPISSVIYFMSLYAGFFVPVEPQRTLCTFAPFSHNALNSSEDKIS